MLGSCANERRPRTWAFTLLEVLVVVTIIALLVAILLPSLAKAKDEAKRTVCAANQNQIATGLAMYANAYQGFIPHSVPAFNASLTWSVWQEFAKAPYPPKGWVHLGLLYGDKNLKDPRILYCPSYREFPHVYPDGWTSYVSPNGAEKVGTSYAYTLNGQVDQYPAGVRVTARQSQLKTHEALFSCVFLGKIDKRQQRNVWPHRGGVNGGFSDGSVQLAALSMTLATTAANLYTQNNITSMDYFAFCFFKMLSGDRHWMNAFPALPP